MRLARLPLLVGALALAVASVGCSEKRTTQGGTGGTGGGTGGTGGSPFGETRIYDLQDPEKQPALNTQVVLDDVVVTAVVERRQPDGSYAPQHFFVQEQAGGPYSGIFVRNGSDGQHVVKDVPAVGDVVKLAGTLDEYYERTQIEVLTLDNKGTGTLPTPAVVDPEAIATGGAEQEAWEGVLVQVDDAISTDAAVLDDQGQDRGNFRINTQGRTEGGVLVGTLMRTGYVRVPGDTFTSVVGVLDYAYEESRLEPRFAEDITFTDGTHPGLRDAGEKTVYQLQNPADPAYPHPPATVTVKDVIVTANAGSRIWVQAQAGGPWSGIQVRLPAAVTAPAVGSKVTLSGTYTEYYNNAQIDEATVEVTGTATVPAPVVVETAAIRTGSADAEQWEGVLVQVSDVQNVEDPVNGSDGNDRGDFRVAPIAGGSVENGVVVGHAFDNDYDGTVGDRFRSIVGVLDYTFSEFVLQARGNDDITFEDGTHPSVPHVGVVSIRDLQDESSATFAGTDIGATVEDVVVTGASTSGFFVQETSGDPKFAGIYVRIPNGSGLVAPTVGSLVTVDGKVFEYFTKTQLQATTIETTGTGTLPAPAVVDAVRVATGGPDFEAYEGVLVEVRDVANVQDPVLGTDGSDRGDFRVGPFGGTEGVVVGHIWPDDYEGEVGDRFDALVGIMDFSFDEARLETRGNADITFDDGSHPEPPPASLVTIPQIQDVDAAGHPAVNSTVRVEDAVVTAVGSRGFWIQDTAATSFAGIYVYRPNGSTVQLPTVGKLVDVEGVYVEFNDLSEITVSAVTVTGDGVVPAPVVVTPDEIAGGNRAEELEGVLVEVRGVENTQDPVLGTDGSDRGDFRVQAAGGTGGVVVGTLIGHDYDGTVGDGFQAIAGVLDYSYGAFRLQPRGNEDIILADGSHPGSGGPVVATIYELQDESDANHPASGADVEVRNVVVTALRSNGSFYVAESAGGAFSGIYAYKPSAVSAPALAVGDVVTLVGEYTEYVSSSAPAGSRTLSEIFLTEVRLESAGTGTVQVAEVTATEIAAGNVLAEDYENCLVRVSNVTVSDASGSSFFKAQATVDADTSDEIYIGKLFHTGLSLTLNQQLSSVTGILDDFSGTYRLHPRGDSDLVAAQ